MSAKKNKRTKAAKFDAIQIQNGALEQEGKFIAAQIKAMRGYEAAAEEKAGVELKKAQDNRTTVEARLANVHKQCKADGFKAFRAMYAPDFGRTKLYQILAIGYGKKTREQVRAEGAERQAKSQAKLKAAAAGSSVTDSFAAAVRLGNGETVKTDGFSEAAKEQLAKAMAGNDADAEASAEQRKADNAAVAEGGTFVDSREKKSKRALMSGKSMLDELLEEMTPEDKSAFFHYFKFHPQMVGVKRAAA